MPTVSRHQRNLVRGAAALFVLLSLVMTEVGRYPRYAWVIVLIGLAIGTRLLAAFRRRLAEDETRPTSDPSVEARKDAMTALVLSSAAVRVASNPQRALRVGCLVALALSGCALLWLVVERSMKRA